MGVSPEQAIDTTTRAFGRHPSFRALHAKGIVCSGDFRATTDAARLCRAQLYSGDDVPATIRFSLGSGNPHEHDWMPGPRGLAVKFYLPGGDRTDIVAVSTPRFPVRTPEAFVELLEIQAAGPAAALRLPRFLARHPEAVRTLPAIVPSQRPPASYATIPYHALHAYRWLDAQGGSRFVRYTLRPVERPQWLSILAARRRGPDYLHDDLRRRVAARPVLFILEVQIAEPGDPTDDPSAAWPRQRRRVTVGTLRVTSAESEREKDGDVLVFDPSRVTDGIECSADPVLAFRPRAYSESIRRRTESRAA